MPGRTGSVGDGDVPGDRPGAPTARQAGNDTPPDALTRIERVGEDLVVVFESADVRAAVDDARKGVAVLTVEPLIAQVSADIAAAVDGRAAERQRMRPGGAAVVPQRAEHGIERQRVGAGLVLYDGAGYSNRNQVSPQTLVDALVRAPDFENTADLLVYLPLGGLEGTVGKRFAGDSAAGFLRAKTGSLTGVTALAGVVTTADGRQLAFATLLDGMPAGQSRPMAAVDDFVNGLAQCGCG